MKAAILVEQGKPLVIAEVRLPLNLKTGQVLVQVHYSGICGSQLGEIDGVKGEDRYLPHLLGHEGSGIVIDVGDGVKHVRPDDRVVMHWRKGLGIESDTPEYLWDDRKLNAGWITTFNEYAIVSENRLTPVEDNVSLDIAALFGCAVTTGFGVITNEARASIGESVVVYGAGGIGLNIIQAASLVCAYPVIAVDLHNNRLELAREFGATHTINATNEDAKKKITDILGSNGADIFIDNTGNTQIIELGYEITGPEGRIILVGVPRVEEKISIYTLPLHFGKTLTGSHGGATIPEKDIPRYLSLYKANRLKLDNLISNYSDIDDINEAIEGIRSGKTSGRCLIRMHHDN